MKKLTNAELGRKTAEEFQASDKMPVIIVLDNVRSAYNVGSVFRTADAFPVEAIYLCGISCHPPHKEIQKTALGAENTVAWKYFKTTSEAIKEIREMGYRVYAVEQAEGSMRLDELAVGRSQLAVGNRQLAKRGNDSILPALTDRFALVFGHEVNGVQQSIIDLCDGCVEIPQGGTKHSLNIAVSAGVVLWELFRKKLKAPD